MAELMLEKWSGSVSEITIGALKEGGGTRSHEVKIGGQNCLPYLFAEGNIPHPPVIAFEVWDVPPADWPEELNKTLGDVVSDPLAWAEKCVRDYKARLLCIRLQGANPDAQNKKVEEETKLIEDLLKKVDVPLIIIGCGDNAKDNQIIPACCQAAKGERCLIGTAEQDNYKTIAAAVLADGHNIIAQSPIDINIAKQLNILVSDMGLPLERIVMDPTTGALGYGLEYSYSIMERARLAALSGDKTVSSPFISFVGQESWRAKEAKAAASEFPAWGPEKERGIIWEIITATALMQAGADILVMRHPSAIEKIQGYIDKLMVKGKG